MHPSENFSKFVYLICGNLSLISENERVVVFEDCDRIPVSDNQKITISKSIAIRQGVDISNLASSFSPDKLILPELDIDDEPLLFEFISWKKAGIISSIVFSEEEFFPSKNLLEKPKEDTKNISTSLAFLIFVDDFQETNKVMRVSEMIGIENSDCVYIEDIFRFEKIGNNKHEFHYTGYAPLVYQDS